MNVIIELIRKALVVQKIDLKMNYVDSCLDCAYWSRQERDTFNQCWSTYGKDFYKMRKQVSDLRLLAEGMVAPFLTLNYECT